jgi:tetratricopeptide (TPR) repeat protein
MERFVATRRDDPSALYAYAHLAVRAGELEKARQAIDEALELRPGWRDAIMLRIRTLLLADGPDAAMAYLAEAVESNPTDTTLRQAYARTLAETQRYEEALEQYRVLVELEPNIDALMAMAMIHLQLGQIDEAEAMLRRVQEAGGNEADLQFYLGWIAEERGDTEQAIAYYSTLGPDSPNHFEARLRIAVLTAGDDIRGARRQLQALRAEEPGQQKRLYQVEAELLQQAEMLEEAMSVLSVALDYFRGDFDLLYARALLAEKMDRLDITENDLRQILASDPDHVDALNALGYTLADRTDRYREAYGYINRALELHPDNNAILDSMGWVMYRLGNHEEAIRYLRRSLAIKHDHEVAAHLGEVLWVSGAHEEAVAVWQRALEISPDDELLRATMQRFIQ